MSPDDIKDLVIRHDDLLAVRSTHEPIWQELASHFYPNGCRTRAQQHETNRAKTSVGQLNSVGRYGMRDFASGMHGGMTSPARPWFQLDMRDATLSNRQDVRQWLDYCTQMIQRVLHASNFYSEVHTFYWQIGSFGTSFMLKELSSGVDLRLRFKTLVAGEYCIDVNNDGIVDTLFRTINFTLRQLALEFGVDRLPFQLKKLYEKQKNWGERYLVTHAIFPRKDGREGAIAKKKPFASVYFIDYSGLSSKRNAPISGVTILRESGYDRFPGFCARWQAIGGDIYGTGPGNDTLADSLLVQQMTTSLVKALHKELDPAMVVPAGNENISLIPGAINPVNELLGGNGPKVYPAAQVKHNIADTASTIFQKEEAIKRGLYNDLFRLLIDSTRRQMTATEVSAKEGEKLMLLGPILERLQAEFFIPLIESVFFTLNKFEILPPAPEDIVGSDMEITFVSMLAQAQKAAATGGMQEMIQFIFQNAQARPEALDALNIDASIDMYADAIGVPVRMLNSQDERDAIRQERSRQIQQQEQAQQASGLMEALGKSGIDPNALLQQVNAVPSESATV